MAQKNKDLQPWLDYFQMLHRYELQGFLQMKPQEHEAYITRAALLTLVPEAVSDPAALAYTLTNLRAYAAYLAAAHPIPAPPLKGAGSEDSKVPSAVSPQTSYIGATFALHIVKEDYPHDLLLTVLLQQRRTWYGRTKEHIEVIDYTEKAKDGEE